LDRFWIDFGLEVMGPLLRSWCLELVNKGKDGRGKVRKLGARSYRTYRPFYGIEYEMGLASEDITAELWYPLIYDFKNSCWLFYG